jgi:CBS domain containing-hemolysin-like protein
MRDVARFGIPFWASAMVIFGVVVLLCDLIPKMIALRAPFRIAAIGVRVMKRILPAVDPLCRQLQQASEHVTDALTPQAWNATQTLDEGELETLIEMSAEEGALHVTESEIIQEIIKLGNKTARDCMRPRIDVFSIPDDLSNEQALPRLQLKRLPRVPVYAETPDNVVGVLDVKRFLLHPELHYTEQLTPPSYVAETMGALDLLRGFLTHPQRLAIVVDEFGGMEGIVTLQDVIEHIISEAVPSSSSHELYIEDFGEGRFVVAGTARLDDLSERLAIPLQEEGIDTIGGVIFNRLGYIPPPGEIVEMLGLRLTVRRATRKRILEILIERSRRETESEGEP